MKPLDGTPTKKEAQQIEAHEHTANEHRREWCLTPGCLHLAGNGPYPSDRYPYCPGCKEDIAKAKKAE